MRTLHPQPKPTPRAKKARKPLRRVSRMVRKRARRIDRETPAETYYKGEWLHGQSCVGAVNHVCDGPIQQAHFRDHTGTGRKEPVFRSIPMCRELHDQYDGRSPCGINTWPMEFRKRWFLVHLVIVHAKFEMEHGRPPGAF